MTVLTQIWTMSAVYLIVLTSEFKPNEKTLEENLENEKVASVLSWTGTILGYITSSLLMDIIGRRMTYILGIAPGLLSCTLASSRNTSKAMIGQALNNLSFGSTTILGLIIIGEYTSPKYRLIFLNLTTAVMYLGKLSNQFLCSVHSSTIVNTSLMLKVLALGIVLKWPESPYWLNMKGLHEASESSFEGTDKESMQEKNDLANRTNKVIKLEQSLIKRTISFLKAYTSKKFRRPVTVVVFGAILAEASGRTYLPLYASKLLAAVTNESPSKYCILFTIASSSLCGCILLRIFRNRKLLLITGLCSVIAMFLGSAYIFLLKSKVIPSGNSWMGILFILLHVIFSNLGATSIPIAHIGEVFPIEYKAIGLLASGVVTSIVSWTALKIATCLSENLYVYGTLVIFGLLMTISLLFLFVILPDTRGRSLIEIEEYYNNGWFSDDPLENEGAKLTQS